MREMLQQAVMGCGHEAVERKETVAGSVITVVNDEAGIGHPVAAEAIAPVDTPDAETARLLRLGKWVDAEQYVDIRQLMHKDAVLQSHAVAPGKRLLHSYCLRRRGNHRLPGLPGRRITIAIVGKPGQCRNKRQVNRWQPTRLAEILRQAMHQPQLRHHPAGNDHGKHPYQSVRTHAAHPPDKGMGEEISRCHSSAKQEYKPRA